MPQFSKPLREQDAAADPLTQFRSWFSEAQLTGMRTPEAAALATASADCAPSVRMVLVKQANDDGFVFYSNYTSRKGEQLAANPRAALLFHWDPLGRQVRVEGAVELLEREQSADYVRSRPRGSQLSALASAQSRVVSGRAELERGVSELASRYAEAELPIPDHWGGYRLIPQAIEFWQHREDRLHDRLLYRREPGGGWRRERLAP